MIYGHRITIYTDHKPLIIIFKKEINDKTARLQRLKLGLLKYDINLEFVPEKKNVLADPLSRLYFNDSNVKTQCADIVHEIVVAPEKVLLISPEKLKMLKIKTKEDECLKNILNLYSNGWTPITSEYNNSSELGKLVKDKDNITVSDELIFFNKQVVVPKGLRKTFLSKLHADHMGFEKTLNKAKQVVYWPFMSNDIKIMSCHASLVINIRELILKNLYYHLRSQNVLIVN